MTHPSRNVYLRGYWRLLCRRDGSGMKVEVCHMCREAETQWRKENKREIKTGKIKISLNWAFNMCGAQRSFQFLRDWRGKTICYN